ncbi:MAG: nicotinamide-nucleotide amidohydrolase family protein [Candidatus Pacebacteria bacterium]|nr:nicotinamide-nucleotide amidohydrolase family protein [Candidatus Paceibacterota bacterium]
MADLLEFDLAILAQSLVARLAQSSMTFTTVESCTGGLVAAAITSVAGSSKVFGLGLVTYANQAKMELAGVSSHLLDQYGAVSAEVAAAMAEGGLSLAAADLALAITGIAGPDGGTATKPVGLVYFALARRGKTTVIRRRVFNGDRGAIRRQAVHYGLILVGDEGFEPPTPSV